MKCWYTTNWCATGNVMLPPHSASPPKGDKGVCACVHFSTTQTQMLINKKNPDVMCAWQKHGAIIQVQLCWPELKPWGHLLAVPPTKHACKQARVPHTTRQVHNLAALRHHTSRDATVCQAQQPQKLVMCAQTAINNVHHANHPPTSTSTWWTAATASPPPTSQSSACAWWWKSHS